MMSERIQNVIHKLESSAGARVIWTLVGILAVAGLFVGYDTRAYRNFAAPEAMDAAQVARNLAEGHGFTTDFIRPFSVYLLQTHNLALHAGQAANGVVDDPGKINGPHPDLANPPVYPLVLAGLMKVAKPHWDVQLHRPFWSRSGNFRRYQPEFQIAVLNQLLLLAVVALTFLIARKLFDNAVAWLAACLTLGSDLIWKFSVSGLSTMLLLVIFLGLILLLIKVEELGRLELPDTRRLFLYAIGAGLAVGLGMLTRYSFGWLMIPVAAFLGLAGGHRRMGLAVAAFLAFAVVVSPWIARNLAVSGTYFGTAGYAVAENIETSPGSRLMQSVDPNLRGAYMIHPYEKKFFENLGGSFQDSLLHLGEGWGGILFFAGLLLGLRNPTARRLRYFSVSSLALFVVVQCLGATALSTITPVVNSENLLVLFTPLVFIFGCAFFLTLLDQMKTPTPGMRYVVIGIVAVLVWRPWVWTVCADASPVAYPPYYPTDVQKVSAWMQPDELMMSDLPWAVAWYGNRTCIWITPDTQTFFDINDYIKPVHALYLSVNCLDSRLLSECMQGGKNSWPNFALKAITFAQIPQTFPLTIFPKKPLQSGMFLTDHVRWQKSDE